MNAIATGGAALLTALSTVVAHRRAASYGVRASFASTACPALSACCAVVAALAWEGHAISWPAAAIVACASVSAVTDLRYGYIFDPVLAIAAAVIVGGALGAGTLADAMLGALLGGGLLLLPYAASRGCAIGFGDVKFAGVAGLALGPSASLRALWIACVCGGAVAAAALATRRARRGTRMPFGPFLSLGVCTALAMGTA